MTWDWLEELDWLQRGESQSRFVTTMLARMRKIVRAIEDGDMDALRDHVKAWEQFLKWQGGFRDTTGTRLEVGEDGKVARVLFHRKKPPQYPNERIARDSRVAVSAEFIVEMFDRWLVSGQNPPLGVCRYSACQRIYVKGTPKQSYCTTNHRVQAHRMAHEG